MAGTVALVRNRVAVAIIARTRHDVAVVRHTVLVAVRLALGAVDLAERARIVGVSVDVGPLENYGDTPPSEESEASILIVFPRDSVP